MNNKNYEDVLNQYIDILMYDIHIKTHELKYNKPLNIETADKIFNIYFSEKIKEFRENINTAKKIYSK
jgi:hypothetical protein|uniref:Uncharacterized protein n=1 Tax=viral metagenome TaxID=1070528 RepID=A0A6C0DNB1_9ZZZZ